MRFRDCQSCVTLIWHHTVNLEALEELQQLGAGELPCKRVWLLVRELFVEVQTLVDFLKTGKIIRCEYLALHDRKIDFHLIQPTGMH